jgi:hypothetical protein
MEKEPEVPLTEPSIIDCLLITGCAVHADAHIVQFTGWVYLPANDYDARRIVVRFAMPTSAARALRAELNRKLDAGH